MTAWILCFAVATAPAAQQRESLLRKLLRIAGLTAAPSQMRGPEGLQPGTLWLVDLGAQTPRALTTADDYRSPVFSLDGRSLYAIRGERVVRVALADGDETQVGSLAGIERLVGFDPEAPDGLVVLLGAEGAKPPLGVLSTKTGHVASLPHDPSSAEEQRILAQLRSDARTYGDTRVYTETNTRSGLRRTIEWTDVFVSRPGAPPVNVSSCEGAVCSQPALSPDSRQIAFVKTGG